MKRFMQGVFAAFAISALISISAFAGDKGKSEKKQITFSEDIMVNGTLIKAGDYDVKFDEATNELSVIKNGKVKAKVPARLEARNEKARDTSVRTVDKGSKVAELVAVTFGGWTQDVVVGSSSTNGAQ